MCHARPDLPLRGEGGVQPKKIEFLGLNILVGKFYVLSHAFYGIQKYSAIGSKMPETCGSVRVISGHFGPFLDPWLKLILRLDVKIDQMEPIYGVL